MGGGVPVRIFVLVGWPEKHQKDYLEMVAEMARLLRVSGVRRCLIECTDSVPACEVIRRELQPVSDFS